MYIWMVNFGYRLDKSPMTIEDALIIMQDTGFESTLHDSDGSLLAYFHPISGTRVYHTGI